ncbi:MAG: neutral/alkaline non-lysosomal ceramidase N-terminal domain-containing protein, partial [Candidatus Latescibacterota bacterium]
ITPPVGAIANAGKPAIGVASELYAKALVFDDGQTKAALVTADVILLGKQVVAETRARIAERTGIPGTHVMFAASHTHSGAATTMRDRWHVIGVDHSYVDQLVAKMAGAVDEAHSRLQEVRVGAGAGLAALSVSRWVMTPKGATWAPNLEAPVDDTVSVLRVDRPDGKPLAALVDYAAHASVMSWGKLFAADYPGFLQSVVEKVYDDQITVLFANGASGDTKVKWLQTKEDGSIDFGYGGLEDARRWGTMLAGEAIKVLEQIDTEDTGNAVSVVSKMIELPMLPLPSEKEVEADLTAKREKGEDTTWEERTLASLREGTARTSLPAEIQIMRIGPDIMLVAIPGELFAEVGLEMRKQLSCKHLFIVGYANGYVGYLPSAKSCREDGDKPRYDWHKFFWYPANFTEEVEPAILKAVRELADEPAPQGGSSDPEYARTS